MEIRNIMADYSINSDSVRRLDRDILEFVNCGLENNDEERFNQLALREFEFQYHTIEPYREHCRRNNISPGTITSWEEIPAVSSFAFKKLLYISFPPQKAEEIYLTSRIVELPRKRGKIYPDKGAKEMMNTANSLLTKAFLFPDVEKMKIFLMVPSPKMAPLMDKAIGLEKVRLKFGTPDSRFLISPLGLDIKTLLSGLRESEKAREPLALISVTGALIHFFNACEKEGIKFSLPQGSRICDVERRRGQFGECSKEEYFRKCRDIMGVEENFCINVLWICESSTIYFDNVLKNYLSGIKKRRCKENPPWTKTIVVDTREFKRLPKGEVGLLRHYDLTNRNLGFAVQTANLGFETEDGFDVMGIWNKKMGEIGIDRSVGHPGGKIVTQMLVYLMRRRLSKIGKIYSRLK